MRTSLHNALRKHRGFTTVELLLTLAVTGVVGLGIASMLLAIGNGTDTKTDVRSVMARHKVFSSRLADAIGGSKRILATGTNYIVLWNSDANGDSQPNLSEIQRIEWNSSTKELWSYVGTVATGGTDTSYQLTADFGTITTNLKTGSSFPGTKWGSNVSAWSTTLNNATVQSATLLSYRYTLLVGQGTNMAVGAVALRQ